MKLSVSPNPEDRNKDKVKQSHDLNQYRRKFTEKVEKATTSRRTKIKR